MTDKFQTEQLLAELPAKLADVRGAVLATLDGITVASAYSGSKSNQLAAMTAASLGLGKRMIETIDAGNLAEISVAGDNGSVFVYAVGARAVLVVVAKQSPNVAMINWEARKIIEQLAGNFSAN